VALPQTPPTFSSPPAIGRLFTPRSHTGSHPAQAHKHRSTHPWAVRQNGVTQLLQVVHGKRGECAMHTVDPWRLARHLLTFATLPPQARQLWWTFVIVWTTVLWYQSLGLDFDPEADAVLVDADDVTVRIGHCHAIASAVCQCTPLSQLPTTPGCSRL